MAAFPVVDSIEEIVPVALAALAKAVVVATVLSAAATKTAVAAIGIVQERRHIHKIVLECGGLTKL